MKKIDFEYGAGTMSANLPDSTDVFIPGVTVPDPPFIPEDKLEQAYEDSIHHPIGMDPIDKLANKDSKVTIVFPDIIKGGNQPTSHRKMAIKVILKELKKVGVKHENILLICSNGLHPKNTAQEIHTILGDEIFYQFWPNQIINHDSEDPDHMVDCGTDPQGDRVFLNKYVYDSDVSIMVGHTQGNPYGGYSGGYKHCATGLNNWRSIAAHHVPRVMHKDDFVPVSTHSTMRHKFNEIGQWQEHSMGKKFFCCDAVLDTQSRQIEINSGWAKEMQPVSWKTANLRTFVPFAEKKYDVLVFGMPQKFHYGDGMGTDPIMLMQALSAQVIRHRRIMSDYCVIICASLCNGFFNDDRWPYMRELFDDWTKGKNNMNTLTDMNRLGEYYATNKEYIRRYRFTNAFHPFHGFSMISCAGLAEMDTSAIYIVGAEKPGYARAMGLKTRATFEDALKDAEKKFVGSEPNILALPKTFSTMAVHLMMKDEDPAIQ
ncbi:lactate racemase domain-containing protein [Companilactobacillus muriivasis]|uniref:lactate racemase domain-containing protein n=1 Tax=Companilactobacillus muriivasis TaxID=3081444 RepID=UPI0030C75E7B